MKYTTDHRPFASSWGAGKNAVTSQNGAGGDPFRGMSCDGRGDRDSEPAQVGRRTLRCGGARRADVRSFTPSAVDVLVAVDVAHEVVRGVLGRRVAALYHVAVGVAHLPRLVEE